MTATVTGYQAGSRAELIAALGQVRGLTSAHADHGYDGFCPVCSGDPGKIADALLAAAAVRIEPYVEPATAVKIEGLREAAAAQRALGAASTTKDGRYEHEQLADWLDERADAMEGIIE